MNEAEYQEIKERLKRDLKVVSFKLVDENEKAESDRQKAIEQSGNTGSHYLMLAEYWTPSHDAGQLTLINGDYKICAELEDDKMNPYYSVYHSAKFIGFNVGVDECFRIASEHFEAQHG